ncbi:hypothetical protein ACF0H5_012633 [Mactra antiquata]
MKLYNLFYLLLLMFTEFPDKCPGEMISVSEFITPSSVLPSSSSEPFISSTDPLPDISTVFTDTPIMSETSIMSLSDITSTTTMMSSTVPPCITPTVDNGDWIFDGDTYILECIEGYQLIGSDDEMCEPVDVAFLPLCLIDCGTPNISNAQVSGDTYDGSNVTVTCHPGRVINGTENITCLDTGDWNSIPECLLDCGNLDPPENGNVDIPCRYDSCQAQYSCNEGFTLTPSEDQINTCDEQSGGWTITEPPVCDPIDCGIPDNVTNAVIDAPLTTYPNEAAVTCNEDFVTNGTSTRFTTITCQVDGQWSDPPDCLYDCGEIQMRGNGDVSYECQTVGCTVIPVCPDGFEPRGATNAVCLEIIGWYPRNLMCINSNSQSSSQNTLDLSLNLPSDPQERAEILQSIHDHIYANYEEFLGQNFVGVVITVSDDGVVTFVVGAGNGNAAAMAQANAALHANPFMLLGEVVPVVSLSVNGSEFLLDNSTDTEQLTCAIYEEITGCPVNKQCQLIKNRIVCVPIPSDGNDGAMIGLTVGVVVFLLLAPCCVFLAYIIHKRRKKYSSQESTISDSVSTYYEAFVPIIHTTVIKPFNLYGRDANRLYGSEWDTNSSISDTSSVYNPHLNASSNWSHHSDDD